MPKEIDLPSTDEITQVACTKHITLIITCKNQVWATGNQKSKQERAEKIKIAFDFAVGDEKKNKKGQKVKHKNPKMEKQQDGMSVNA